MNRAEKRLENTEKNVIKSRERERDNTVIIKENRFRRIPY
jgi:hypothetical protein